MVIPSPIEPQIRDLLSRRGCDLVIPVPCKHFAELLTQLEDDPRFELVMPCREEEGVGIAAGAYLAGRRPVVLMQNSGLGNLINAYASLYQYYGLPLCVIMSHRGDRSEKVPAQVPMGSITRDLLDVIDVHCIELAAPADLALMEQGLDRYLSERRSVALLCKQAFWAPSA